jgi:hypothetical protein
MESLSVNTTLEESQMFWDSIDRRLSFILGRYIFFIGTNKIIQESSNTILDTEIFMTLHVNNLYYHNIDTIRNNQKHLIQKCLIDLPNLMDELSYIDHHLQYMIHHPNTIERRNMIVSLKNSISDIIKFTQLEANVPE